jgi:hydrogenase nickel incorporation protein HypA/HybF
VHELGIARNIVAIVAEAACGRRVSQVVLEIGALSGVVAEAVLFCFDAVAQGTELEGAILDIRAIEGRARCLDCAAEFAVGDFLAACPCGSRRLALIAGEELNIKAMELDEVA